MRGVLAWDAAARQCAWTFFGEFFTVELYLSIQIPQGTEFKTAGLNFIMRERRKSFKIALYTFKIGTVYD